MKEKPWFSSLNNEKKKTRFTSISIHVSWQFIPIGFFVTPLPSPRPTHLCRPTNPWGSIDRQSAAWRLRKLQCWTVQSQQTTYKGVENFCVEVFTRHTPPEQWVTNVFVPLQKKGDCSLMTSYRGITLMSFATKVYNKVLLVRIRYQVDPMLRKTKLDSVLVKVARSKGTSCEGSWKPLAATNFHSPSLSLTSRSYFDSINRSVMFAILRHYFIPKVIVNAISCHGGW